MSLTVENYQILQASKEANTELSHNYHTVDLRTATLSTISANEMLLALNIDRSGSMADKAADGHNSLQHTIHTTKNIIHFLGELKEENPALNINLLVNAFDDKNTTIGHLEIGDKTTDEYLERLEKLKPRGTTNIGEAFKKIKDDAIWMATPVDKRAHILMTDGQPTAGKTSAEGIVEHSPGGKQIMIGYGVGHDAKLLQKMAELTNGSSHFVDNIENAGMVYGEIIHGLLYSAVKDVEVAVTGAEVYDFTKNEWTTSVRFSCFASEHTQTLLLRSSWDSVEVVSIIMGYTDLTHKSYYSNTDVFNSYNCTGKSKQRDRNVGVEKQMFRQKVLDALFRVGGSILEEELVKLRASLEEFMSKNKLEDDTFMQKLVTDVYVAYTSVLFPINAAAFIGARLSSQGNQQAYDINDFDGLTNNLATSIFGSQMQTIPAIKSLRQTSCYATPTQTMVMRSCSTSL